MGPSISFSFLVALVFSRSIRVYVLRKKGKKSNLKVLVDSISVAGIEISSRSAVI